MDSEYILRMRFRTAQNRYHNITLNNTNIDADDHAEPVMDTIISDNIFTTAHGDLAAKHSVTKIIRDYTAIVI